MAIKWKRPDENGVYFSKCYRYCVYVVRDNSVRPRWRAWVAADGLGPDGQTGWMQLDPMIDGRRRDSTLTDAKAVADDNAGRHS